jgi:hypothetical protein
MIPLAFSITTVSQTQAKMWEDEEYVAFYELRDAVRKYRDLRIYEDGVNRYFCSRHVNVMKVTTKKIAFVADYWMPNIAPAWLWVSYKDPVLNTRIYAQAPQTEVAIRNPNGFGVVPKPGWKAECIGNGFGKSIVTYVQEFLDRNAPIDYMR